MVASFERLSLPSRRSRFFTGVQRLSRTHLAYLTQLDHHNHEVIAAATAATREGIGVARFVRSREQPERAEIAVTIADSWQGRGLGSAPLGIWAVGLVGAGAFVTDAISGYLPGTPAIPEEVTTTGALHDLFSVPGFFALGTACFVLATGGGWRWAVYSVLSGVALLITFFVSGVGFEQTEGVVDVAGLWQRVSVTIGWVWLTLLAMRSLRPADAPPQRGR